MLGNTQSSDAALGAPKGRNSKAQGNAPMALPEHASDTTGCGCGPNASTSPCGLIALRKCHWGNALGSRETPRRSPERAQRTRRAEDHRGETFAGERDARGPLCCAPSGLPFHRRGVPQGDALGFQSLAPSGLPFQRDPIPIRCRQPRYAARGKNVALGAFRPMNRAGRKKEMQWAIFLPQCYPHFLA